MNTVIKGIKMRMILRIKGMVWQVSGGSGSLRMVMGRWILIVDVISFLK